MTILSKKRLKYASLGSFLIVVLYRMFLANDEEQSTPITHDVDTAIILKQAAIRNQVRRSHIEEVCRRYNLGKYRFHSKLPAFKEPPAPQYEIFYYDLKHRLSWCPIYKAGSSTWLYNFALLRGSTDEQIANSNLQISDFVRNLLPPLTSREAKAILPNSLKFVVVRHPFERLVSAYRDKLESIANGDKSGSVFYYKKFGRKIVTKYRNRDNKTNSKISLKAKQRMWNGNAEPVGVEPTFKEFVRYLIDTDLATRADDHWIPFYLYCTPCWITYDIIGKVETMLQDQLLILYAANLHEKIAPSWRHRMNPFNHSVENEASEIAKIYFSQLHAPEVKQLYEKYRLDFELFQYEAFNYYKYVAE